MKPKNRPYSRVTDMMLIIMHNEGDSLQRIAELLTREEISIEKRIVSLFVSGEAYKIHERLMAQGGLYAHRMAGKSWPQCRFNEERGNISEDK